MLRCHPLCSKLGSNFFDLVTWPLVVWTLSVVSLVLHFIQERFEELQTRLRDTASELKKKDDMIAQLRTAQQQLHRRNVVLESLYKTGSMLLPTSGALSTSAPVFASLPSSASPAIKPVSSPTEPLQSVSAPFNTRTPPLAVAAVPGGAAPWPETVTPY